MSKTRNLVVFGLVALAGREAWGQAPFVHNLLVLDPQTFVATDTYQDIPESDQSVTIPTGTAVIMWSVFAQGGTAGLCNHVRPVIGTQSPTEGQYVPTHTTGAGNIGTRSGTWATLVEGGTVTVKLQARRDSPACTDGGGFAKDMSWTLIVLPDAAGNVPAVGVWGLLVMLLMLVGGGTMVLRQRRIAA